MLDAGASITDLLRVSPLTAALLAGTIAQRSHPELGWPGLAARHGFGNPTMMVQGATGLSRIEAGRLLAVGVLVPTLKLLNGRPPTTPARLHELPRSPPTLRWCRGKRPSCPPSPPARSPPVSAMRGSRAAGIG